MNIEESIIEFKKMIERDKDTLRYWKSDTFGHYDEPIKKLEKDVLISETLLTAYEKEKEANKKLDKEAQGYLEELAGDGSMNIRRIQELEAELEKEKEKNKEHKQRITYLENKIFNQKQTIKEGGIKQC